MQNPFDQFDSAPSQGSVTVGSPRVDPYKVSAERRAEEDQQFQREKFAFEREKAERELAQGPKTEASAKARTDAITGYKAAQSLRRYVADMRRKFEAGPGATRGITGAIDYLPTEANRQFDASGNAARGIVGQALGFTGGQLNSVQEAEMAIGPFLPTAGDYDDVALDKINRLEQLAQDAEERAIMILGGRPDEAGRLQPVEAQPEAAVPAPEVADQSRNLAELNAPAQEQLQRSTGGYQTVDNPELAGVRGEYLRRLEAGEGAGQLIQFLRSAGITDPALLRTAAQQAAYRKQNPNVPIANYSTGALDDMDVPLSATESMLNSAAQTAPGAYLMRAGQAASLGTLDNIAGMTGGNAERVRIGLEDAGRSNPIAATVGDISGSVIAGLGAEAGLAARGLGAGLVRSGLADLAIGAGTGAGNADSGDRLSGALSGGAAGLAGGLAGAGVMKGAAAAISPTGGALKDLYASGVRPTIGQRAAASGGLPGRVVSMTEEGIGSIPIVGATVRGARQDARDQFQLGAYNQALGELKPFEGVLSKAAQLPAKMKPGTAPYAYTKQVFNEAYDKARSGMRIAADEELSSDIGDLAGQAAMLAEPSVKRFEHIVRNVVMRRAGATMEGAEFKKVQSDLGRTISEIRKNKTGDDELASVLEGLQASLDRAARRHSDPQAVSLLDAADAGYAKFVRIRAAAKSRGGPAAEFTPNQFDRAVQSSTSGRHSDAYLRGDALMQEYAQQGMALADNLPNSGTADRFMVGAGATGIAGGASFLEPTTAGVLGLLSALYAPGVRKGVAGAMAPRGPKAQKIADSVRKRARIAGATGAGVALSAQTDDDR